MSTISKENKLSKQELLEARTRKRKKNPYSSLTYTTGDIGYNLKQFNKRMGTDFSNPSTEEAKAQRAAEKAAVEIGTILAATPDGGSSISSGSGDSAATASDAGTSAGESGGMSESLLNEAKRYVRRYYIRPQNVFCSNKTDIIQALIEFEDQDCTIYTLNNLGDIKDVTKLTPKDIIYYYEDSVLYDKNHVRIMDYDLYIKHEENRKNINPETASDSELNKVYADRITGTSDVGENLVHTNTFDTNFDSAVSKLLMEKATDNEADSSGPSDDTFNLAFDDYNVYGEKVVDGEPIDDYCCICGEPLYGYGNNAEPYTEGRCCDACNIKFVIPARLAELEKNDEDL